MPRGHQVSHAAAWIPTCHQSLSDEDYVRAGSRQVDHITRSAHPGLRYPDNVVGDQRRQPGKDRRVDVECLQITRVDTNDGRAGLDRTAYLVGCVHLDQGCEPDGTSSLDE